MHRTFNIVFWTLCPGVLLGLIVASCMLGVKRESTQGFASSRALKVTPKNRPAPVGQSVARVERNTRGSAAVVRASASESQQPAVEAVAVHRPANRPVLFRVIKDERPGPPEISTTDLKLQQMQEQLQRVLTKTNEAAIQQTEQMQRLAQQMQQQQLNQMEQRLVSMQSTIQQVAGEGLELRQGTAAGRGTVVPFNPQIAQQERLPAPESVRPEGLGESVPSERIPEIVKGEPSADGEERFSLQIRDTEITQVLDMLGEISGVNMIPSLSVTGKVTVNLTQVTLNEALQALLRSTGLVFEQVGNLYYVSTPEEIVARSRDERRLITKVYRPQYISVQDLQTLLFPLLSQPSGKIAVTLSPDMTGSGVPGSGMNAGVGQSSSGVSSGGVGSGGVGGGSIGGQSQAGSNRLAQQDALLVRDFPEIIAEFDRIVEEMDVPPQQVHIEAMILSVKLDDSMALGVNFALLNGKDNQLFVSGNGAVLGGTSGFPGGTNTTISPPNPFGDFLADAAGLKYGFIRGDISAFVSALENITDTNLIATPQLMVLNKQKAQLIIGERLSYSTSTFQNNQSIQNVNFVDAGTKLSLRPFVAPDGLVRMEIHPERSSAVINRITGLPDIATTEVTSNVMVRDGTTIVIGGLIEEQVTESQERIPLLGALPVVGAAFRNKNEQTERRELIILITPRIVREEQAIAEADSAKYENERRAQHFQDKLAPANRRNLTRVHYNKALQHYERGEFERARHHVREAARQNKQDRQVLRLQERIDESIRQQRRSWIPWGQDEQPVEEVISEENPAEWETTQISPDSSSSRKSDVVAGR